MTVANTSSPASSAGYSRTLLLVVIRIQPRPQLHPGHVTLFFIDIPSIKIGREATTKMAARLVSGHALGVDRD